MSHTTTLSFNGMNVSAQVGDIAYYSPVQITGAFNTSSISTTIKLGEIIAINGNSITIEYDSVGLSAPPAGSFISFAKNHTPNTSGLVGYYADVKFENNSTGKIELFSVGSEVTQSSK
jgi:hypothetical protein